MFLAVADALQNFGGEVTVAQQLAVSLGVADELG
jgi:hypothetical protein